LKAHAALKSAVLVARRRQTREIWAAERWAAYHKSSVEPAYRHAAKTLEI